MAVVIHKCAKQRPKKLAKNEDADCTTCAFAKKLQTIDDVDEYECEVALYDIKTLACYVKREQADD